MKTSRRGSHYNSGWGNSARQMSTATVIHEEIYSTSRGPLLCQRASLTERPHCRGRGETSKFENHTKGIGDTDNF